MKKFIIPILMLCLGYAGMMHAANTDISSLNNVIYLFSKKEKEKENKNEKESDSCFIC